MTTNEMTKQELNQLLCTLSMVKRDLGYCQKRIESLYARYARDARCEETKESKEEAERESSPHTPYKEKGEEENKERKEDSLAQIARDEAHPLDERVCVSLKSLFEKFWRAYPKKVAKIAAERTFERIVRREKAQDREAFVERLCRALAKQRQSDDWQREEGRYVPYPATWLNAGRWEDEDAVALSPSETPASAETLAWLYAK